VREEARTKLQNETYKLSDADAEVFGKDAAQALSRHAAELHMNVYESVFNAMLAAMPRMLEDFMGMREAKGKFEDAFFGEFPALKPFSGEVHKALQLTAAMYPTLGAAELRQQVGMALSLQKKLPLPGMAPVAPGGSPAAPAAPAAPAPTPIPSFTPAAPGGGGGAAMPPPAAGAGNVFTAMAIEDEEAGR
jgi:hypothetical protein